VRASSSAAGRGALASPTPFRASKIDLLISLNYRAEGAEDGGRHVGDAVVAVLVRCDVDSVVLLRWDPASAARTTVVGAQADGRRNCACTHALVSCPSGVGQPSGASLPSSDTI
jgi:hypothetical protein